MARKVGEKGPKNAEKRVQKCALWRKHRCVLKKNRKKPGGIKKRQSGSCPKKSETPSVPGNKPKGPLRKHGKWKGEKGPIPFYAPMK